MKTRTIIWLWLALLAIFFIPWLWYLPNHLIIGGDLTFPLDPDRYFSSIFQLWRRVYTGVNSAISLTTLPFYAPMALFDALGFSLQTVQKLHFGFWLAAPALSMFYLAGVLFREHPKRLMAQLIAVSVYLFNTYQVVWVDSARMAVWVGLPLMLGLFIQGLNDQKHALRYGAGIALASVITSTAAANPPMFLVFAAIFLFWLIFHLATKPADRKRTRLKQIGFFVLVTGLLSLLVNLYWIVPYAKVLLSEYRQALSSGLGGINFQNWLDPVSTHTSLLNVFRLQGAWDWYAGWGGEPYVPAAYPYQHQPFYLLWSVLVPILAFGALLVKDPKLKTKTILFFAGLALLGLLFGAGSHPPTGKFYSWLVEHLPFFSIYRSPWYKFTTWTVLGYSILTAISFIGLTNWLDRKTKYLIPLLLGLFLLGNTIYASGLVLGKVFPKKEERVRLHAAHVAFPDYFFRAADWVNKKAGDFRLLQLPAQEAFNYRWGLGTLMDMSLFTFRQPTLWWPEQTGSGPAKPGAETLVKTAYQDLYTGRTDKLSRLLGLLNVRYLLQKNDIDWSFYRASDSPDFIKVALKKQQLPLVHTEGPWDFYEVPPADQRPLIYPTTNYIQTTPAQLGLERAVFDDRYKPHFTYNDADPRATLPKKLVTGQFVTPDLQATQFGGTTIVVPIDIPVSASYDINLPADEGEKVTLQGTSLISEVKVDLKAGKHMLALSRMERPNLIQNSSFEEGPWEQPFDPYQHIPGTDQSKAEVVADHTDGAHSVKLTSDSRSVVIRKGIDQFEENRTYLIAFDYKYGQGKAPRYTIWQEGSLVFEPSAVLPKNQTWQTYQAVFRPKPGATGAYLFLFADGDKETPLTEAYYDNVRVIKLPKFLEELTFTHIPPTTTTLPKLSYVRQSPTRYVIHVTDASDPFLVNFLEQYDVGWQASIANQPVGDHLRAYNYANTWYIERAGDFTIKLWFRPQQTFHASLTISVIGILLSLLLLLTPRRRQHDA